MKNWLVFLMILFLGFTVFGFSSRDKTLYYAAPHFPPWDITLEKNNFSGINADVIHTIAKEMGLDFQPVGCPWKRCLLYLEEGKIDIAGTVGRTPERERFLHFIEPTYAKAPDQVFYLPINSKVEIRSFEDLYQFDSIGIERGARIFPRFDKDAKLKKDEITDLDQLLRMLDRGRLDVVAGNEMVMDYIINKTGMNGKFKKASYRFVSNEMEYLAISKKSPHIKRLAEISQVVRKLKESGKIDAYIRHYTKEKFE